MNKDRVPPNLPWTLFLHSPLKPVFSTTCPFDAFLLQLFWIRNNRFIPSLVLQVTPVFLIPAPSDFSPSHLLKRFRTFSLLAAGFLFWELIPKGVLRGETIPFLRAFFSRPGGGYRAVRESLPWFFLTVYSSQAPFMQTVAVLMTPPSPVATARSLSFLQFAGVWFGGRSHFLFDIFFPHPRDLEMLSHSFWISTIFFPLRVLYLNAKEPVCSFRP